MKRSLTLDPETSFEPRAATKRAWLSTRKKAITVGGGDCVATHSGLFDTDSFVWDTIWVVGIVAAEVFSLAQLRLVGAFENVSVLAGFCALDFLSAAFAHCGTAARTQHSAWYNHARTRDEQVWASAHGPSRWQRLICAIGILGLLGSAAAKAAFFVLNAEFSAVAVAIPVIYAVIFYGHLKHTGSWLAHLWFRLLLGLDWRRFAAGDPDLRFTHPRIVRIISPVSLNEVMVNNQRIVRTDGANVYDLEVCGVLQDDEAADLANHQQSAEAKVCVLRSCLEFQLGQLNLNANQLITTGRQQLRLLLPAAIIFCAVVLSSCAKAKVKATTIERVDVTTVLAHLPQDKLPSDLAELTMPFLRGATTAVVPSVRVVARSTSGPNCEVVEAELRLSAQEQSGGWLNRIFGSSGVTVETLQQHWLDRTTKPLAWHPTRFSDRADNLLEDDAQFFDAVRKDTKPAGIIAYECGNTPFLANDAVRVKAATEFHDAVDRLLSHKSGGAPLAIALVDGFDSSTPSPNAVAPAEIAKRDEAVQPAAAQREAGAQPLPAELRSHLPALLQPVFDRGTARVALTVYFATQSSELPVQALPDLNKFETDVGQLRNPIIIVTAYADRRGSDDQNLRLSRLRAVAIARDLQRRKIPVAAALGLGDALELDRTKTAEGLALNRRADVIIIETSQPAVATSGAAERPPQKDD